MNVTGNVGSMALFRVPTVVIPKRLFRQALFRQHALPGKEGNEVGKVRLIRVGSVGFSQIGSGQIGLIKK